MTPHRLEYAPRYFRRLEDIRERLAADNPAAARRMIMAYRTAGDTVQIITVLHGAQRWPDRLP